MSILSSTRKAGPFACNGTTVAFPFAFKVFAPADVYVVRTDPNGVESDLVLGADYTVALNADQDANPGGTVTTTVAYSTGYKITLTSRVPNLQPVTLTNQGAFYPRVINDALDRLTILVQQLAEQVGRAVKVGISSSSTPDQIINTIISAASTATAGAAAAASSASTANAAATAADASAAAATAAAQSAAQAAAQAAVSAQFVGVRLDASNNLLIDYGAGDWQASDYIDHGLFPGNASFSINSNNELVMTF